MSIILYQVTINKLVRQWGIEEFIQRADKLRDFYKHRRDVAVEATEKHLKGIVLLGLLSYRMIISKVLFKNASTFRKI